MKKYFIRKFINWYFTQKALPYWCILAMDCIAVAVSGFSVYYLKYGGLELASHFWQVFWGISICVLAYLLAFIVFHTAHGIMRYSSFVDLRNIAYSNLAAGLFACFAHQIEIHFSLSAYYLSPRFWSTIYIFVIATALMWALRIVVRSLHDMIRGTDSIENVFIYGCMQGGVAIAKSIRNYTPSVYRIKGFISNDKSLDGSWLLGERVYFDDDSVVDIMKSQNVTTVYVSPLHTESFTQRVSLIDALAQAGIKIMMMPHAEEWDGRSDLNYNRLKHVEIEELLPREKIEVDMVAIGQMLRGKRILITGAAGSIGSEISRQVAKFRPSELILVDQAETPMHDVRLYMANNHAELRCHTIVSSITDREHMERIFADYKPEYVFHAAAYKHVPMMEDNPGQAIRNNVFGTRVIADLAVKYGTQKFVMISTDKAVNPTNVMGCSKRICEIYCQSLNSHQNTTRFITTRFGNVLGSNGSVIPIFKKQIKEGGPVKVTHPEIIRYFMLIPEACRLVLEAGAMGNGGEIYVFDMGEPVKIVDLAKRMILLSGAKDIKIEYSGLRDGEKLYEELLATKENTKPTPHAKIMVAQAREYPYELALKNEIELYNLSNSFDDMAIVKKMKEIVPEYKSQNSKYKELDR